MKRYIGLVVGLVVLLVALGFVLWAPVWASTTLLTPQTITITSPLTPVYTTVTQSVTFANNGQAFLHVKNSSGATITATVVTHYTYKGIPLGNLDVPVAAGSEKMFGPFEPTIFNFPSGTNRGQVEVDFSSVTSVTLAILGWE